MQVLNFQGPCFLPGSSSLNPPIVGNYSVSAGKELIKQCEHTIILASH